MNQIKKRNVQVTDLQTRYNYKFYLRLILSGVIMAIASKFFIIYANIFSPGIGGLAQGVSYTMYDMFGHTLDGVMSNSETFNNVFYWVIYGIMNIPIIWFTYIKFGKDFLLRSLVVMASSLIVTMILTFVPGIKDAAFISDWNAELASDFEKFTLSSLAGVLGGMIYGFGVGMAFKEGVSSMGFDPIAKHLQRDKGMEIKTVMFIVAFVNSFIWIFVSAGIDGKLTTVDGFFDTMVSPRILGSILFLGVYSTLMSSMASHKPVKVEITSFNGPKISEALNERFQRTHSITEITGGYSKRKAKRIEMVLYRAEMEDLLNIVSESDDKAFIITTSVDGIYAQFESVKTKSEKAIDAHRKNLSSKKKTK